MKKKTNRVPLYIIVFCVFLIFISIYYEKQKKAAVLGLNSSFEYKTLFSKNNE